MPSNAAPSSNSLHHSSAAPRYHSDKESGSEAEPEMDSDEVDPEMDSDDDDVEYEEIEEEVEVEEEVEEEVEVDEEIEEEEVSGEELSDSPIDDDRNDVSQDMEPEGPEEHLKLSSSDPKQSVANLPPDTLAVGGGIKNPEVSSARETPQKSDSRFHIDDPKGGKPLVASKVGGFRESAGDKNDSLAFAERETVKDDDAQNDNKDFLFGSAIMTSENITPLSFSKKEEAAAISIGDGHSAAVNSVMCLETGIERQGTNFGENINQGPKSSTVPQIRPRSVSPLVEFNDGNKRPAVICDFFAKGWCIKGNSCRFLHVKDHLDINSEKPGGDVAALNKKSELQADGGLRDGTESSRSRDLPNATASSVACSSSFSLEGGPSLKHRESQKWHHFNEKHKILSVQMEDISRGVSPDSLRSPLYKDSARSISPFKDDGKENIKRNWSSDDYPIYGNSCFPGHKSLASNSAASSDTYQTTGLPSHATSLEDMVTRKSQFMLYDHSSPVLSSSRNLSFGSSLPNAGMLPSDNATARTRSPFSFSSLDKGPLATQKLSDRGGEYRASGSSSLLRSSSPFFGSEPENHSLTNVSGDPLHIAGLRTKFSSNDWEPSVPFRSSFLLAQSLSSAGNLYDPIRDSIEQPNLEDRSSRFNARPEASITSTHLRVDGGPFLIRTLGPESGPDKHYMSELQKFPDNMPEKNFQGKSLFTADGENVRVSQSERSNRSTLLKEEKLSSPAHVKETANANKIYLGSDSRFLKDGPRQKKELKVDSDKQNYEMDVDFKIDGDQKESKALKHFRAALVEFVKEVVKPFWREGHLSKDAHKVIVKKAVEKVLSTLQPHQTPNTAESIKQYLSASQPKILKLVQGYVVKYGKS